MIILSFVETTICWAVRLAMFAIDIRCMLVQNVGMEYSEKIDLAGVELAKLSLFAAFFSPSMVCNLNFHLTTWTT